LVYRLSEPGFTIYHRAALGGLAATIRDWTRRGDLLAPSSYEPDRATGGGTLAGPDGVRVDISLDSSEIKLNWPAEVSDRQAIALLLQASFRKTEDGMIYLPGLGVGADREDVLLAVHNGLSQSFLQYPKKRPGIGIGMVALKVGDADQADLFSFKKVDKYSHQVAQGTGLLGEGWEVTPGEIPKLVPLSQALLPGAMTGASELEGSPRDAFLLQYLIVACAVFLVRSRRREEKVQSCLIVPDVTDLRLFAMRLHRMDSRSVPRFCNTYLGRIVGGAEEAALRFLLDLRAGETAKALGVASFLVVAMGKVPWDRYQQNRSGIARVQTDYPEMGVFEAAAAHLSKSKVFQSKKGEPFVVPDCPVPELVAANLAAGEHWCAHFRDLVAKKREFLDMSHRREGLHAMQNAISQDKRGREDRLVIQCFQEAWRLKMGAFWEQSGGNKRIFQWRTDRERERIRNDILRCKTSDGLANWLLRFAADASRATESRPASPLMTFKERGEELREIIFNPRNTDRLQNLLLFALLSYASARTLDEDGNDAAPNSSLDDNK
jgi:CRISPR-associated protein Cas8a1/Csx13